MVDFQIGVDGEWNVAIILIAAINSGYRADAAGHGERAKSVPLSGRDVARETVG